MHCFKKKFQTCWFNDEFKIGKYITKVSSNFNSNSQSVTVLTLVMHLSTLMYKIYMEKIKKSSCEKYTNVLVDTKKYLWWE